MDWNNIHEILPNDEQEIIVYHENFQKEMYRTFYIEFWEKYKRIYNCDLSVQKWKPIN